MSNNTKVIAFHLPQYHAIPENDKWWGPGFTEWTNVKKAKKYYKDQEQPRVPLNHNYYDLLDINNLKWQSDLAKQYGIYGFCFYHYWFNGHMLLEKPVELFRDLESDDKCNYCICWANEDWTRAWADKRDETLIQQKYGNEEEWKSHFEYLLSFFKDEKYILENGKPVLVIYRPELIFDLEKMLLYWNQLAKENGFEGMCFMYQQYSYLKEHGKEEELFDYNIEYQPSYALNQMYVDTQKASLKGKVYSNLPKVIQSFVSNTKRFFLKKANALVYDYDAVWEHIISVSPSSEKAIPGAFVDYDNSPRRREKCTYFKGVDVGKFKKYFKKQVMNSKENYNNDYLFVFAWNEWGESAYLEPDEKNQYAYLEAIKEALAGEKQDE